MQAGAVVIVILAVILASTVSRHDFRLPADNALMKAGKYNYYILADSLLKEDMHDCLLVTLDSGVFPAALDRVARVSLQPSSLQPANVKTLLPPGKRIILFSADPSVSARAWLWLIQEGYSRVSILIDGQAGHPPQPPGEQLRYTFKPDTSQV